MDKPYRDSDGGPKKDIELATTSPRTDRRASSDSTTSEDGQLLYEGDGRSTRSNAYADDALQRSFRRFNNLPLSVLISFCIVIAVALVALIVSLRRINGSAHGPHWKGFSKIDHVYAFGDSWTDSHFMPFDEQPSTVNPMGNPPFPGGTSSHARNYIEYLTTEYNHSFIKAYDLALSGAVVNTTIIPAFVDWLDLVHETKDRFMYFYTNSTTPDGPVGPVGWSSDSSLFTFFFGINDVAAADKEDPPWDALFDSYETTIDTLYSVGARNFLIMNVPPIDRAPAITKVNDTQYAVDVKRILALYNNRVKMMAASLREKYEDSTVFEFDTWALFTKIMDNPQSVPQTRSYVDVENACDLWEKLDFGAIPTKEQVEHCGGLGIEQSLWINSFHVSWPAHDAIAAALEHLLTKGV